MNMSLSEFIKVGDTWEIRVGEERIGRFLVRSLDSKGNVIGDLPEQSEAGGRLKEVFGPLESALQAFSFAVAHEEELNLARQGLSLHHEGRILQLNLDFEGLIVLFDEARFSFHLNDIPDEVDP